jgi:hypothetical protein
LVLTALRRVAPTQARQNVTVFHQKERGLEQGSGSYEIFAVTSESRRQWQDQLARFMRVSHVNRGKELSIAKQETPRPRWNLAARFNI